MEFNYQAKQPSGDLIEGKIEAPSEDQAVSLLHQKNLVVLSLNPVKQNVFSVDLSSFLSKPSKKDIVIFTRQMATLVDADVPLVEGLHTMARQIEKESFRKVVLSIVSSVEGGASLSVALSEHPAIFGRFYISLVRSGEVAGKLQETLSYLADYLERSAGLTSKIMGALYYPAFILCAMVVVVIVLMTTVLPNLLSIIKDAGVTDLPLTTKLLMAVTGFFNKFLIPILIAIIGAIAGFLYYIKTPGGRGRFDDFKVKMPRFGKVVRDFYLARIAETLSTLIKAGVPILEGIGITSDVVGNATYRNILLEAAENVRGGGTISEVFEKHPEFPPLVSSMLAIGEKTGRTDFMLENIFGFYKTEAENSIQNLSQLIEPVLILVLGVGVAGLVSAVLMPIYSLVGAG
jgi:type IV pilus assembly protein PilC